VQNTQRIAQFQLFQTPSSKIPQWETPPYELRRRTVPLLAPLLRQQYARSVAAKRAEETCDE
jgi:hypothetical protein